MERNTILKSIGLVFILAVVIIVSIKLEVFRGYVIPLAPVVILSVLQKKYGWNEFVIYGISATYYLTYIFLI